MHACMARRKAGRPRRRMYARDVCNQSPCTGRTHAKSHHARTSKVQSVVVSGGQCAGAARAELMGRSVIDARSASKRDRPSRHGRPSIARLREGEVLPGRTLVPIPHRLSGARIASRLAFASHNHKFTTTTRPTARVGRRKRDDHDELRSADGCKRCVHLIREGEIEWCVQAYVDRSLLGRVKTAEEISKNPTLHCTYVHLTCMMLAVRWCVLYRINENYHDPGPFENETRTYRVRRYTHHMHIRRSMVQVSVDRSTQKTHVHVS